MKHILLLEDDLRLASFWQTALEQSGLRVTHCSDASAAISVCDSQAIDLVVTDILIRDEQNAVKPEGGLSLISHIRLHQDQIPILCVTGADPSLQIQKHLELFSVQHIMTKPIDVTTLVRTVRLALGEPSEAD